MTAVTVLGALGMRVATATPTPSPTPPFNPNDVTPGVLGFVMTALLFVAVGLLVWRLIVRVSRHDHRMRVRRELVQEVRERDARAEVEPGRESSTPDVQTRDGESGQAR